MKILVYKRTHKGDPNSNGVFGVNGCMGQVRQFDFDIVIGVGGIGSEARSHKIDNKVNWVGINPIRDKSLVKFKFFKLFEENGIELSKIAPEISKRLYEKNARFIFTSLTQIEKEEAQKIIDWAKVEENIYIYDDICKSTTSSCKINIKC